MTTILLFCISEEAKPFVREVLNCKAGDGPNAVGIFSLVESNVFNGDRSEFRTELQEGDTFQSDFIGALKQDCQAWAQEKQSQVNFIDHDFIAIVDARSAQDKTVLVSTYHYDDPDEPPFEFKGFGALPRERNIWYDYRVNYQHVFTLHSALMFGPIDSTYPSYFGRKEDFTDEHGVFDVPRAERFTLDYNPEDYTAGSPRL